MSSNDLWHLEGVEKDGQSITQDWTFVTADLIEGVALKEIRNVPKQNGYLTEIFRQDWFDGLEHVDQIFQVVLFPGGLSAWHAHAKTTDRLFVSDGLVRVALYDDRPESSTRGRINEFRLGTIRPGLVAIPPGVWHGVQNIGDRTSTILNIVDAAYDYESPDHWRLPSDTDEIPFSFGRKRAGDL